MFASPAVAGWLILALGTILLFLLNRNDVVAVRHLTNSDSLFPTIFSWDFLRQHYSWAGFQFPRIPSFVPDLALYLPLFSALGDYRQAIFVYAIVQAFAFFALGGVVVSRIAGCPVINGALVLLMVMTGVLLIDRFFPPIPHHRLIFTQVEHGGVVLISLAALVSTLPLLTRWGWAAAGALVTICFLGFLSDRLFAFAHCLAAATGLAVLWFLTLLPRHRALAIVACVAAGVALALVADRLLFRQPDIRPSEVADHFAQFVVGTGAFLRHARVSATLTLAIPILVFIGAGIWWLGRRVSGGPQSSVLTFRDNDVTPMFAWIYFAVGMTAVIPITAAIYIDEGGYRYLGTLLYWPILGMAIILASLIPRIVMPMSFAYLPVVAAIIFATAGHNGFAPLILRWENPLSMCLLKERDALGLKAGLAEYWVARPAMVGTGFSLQLDQITRSGDAYLWSNNWTWFDRSYADPSVPPQYNFIVMNEIHESEVRQKFGSPDRIAVCDTFTFWLYDDTAALRRKLLGRAD